MSIVLPDGVWAVMLTPFNDDKSIDTDGISRLVEFYIANGVAGIFACCGSSEIRYLTKNEMLDISRQTIDCVDGRVPVISGAIVFDQLSAQVEFTNEISATGADAVIVSSNQFNDKDDSDDQFLMRIKEFASKIDPNIYLGTYELPEPYKRLIASNIYGYLAQSGKFVFHKDTSCDINVIKEKIEISKGTKLKFFNANLQTLFESFKFGCNGYCGTGTNYCPELYCWLFDNFKSDPKKAQQLQEFLNEFEQSVDLGRNYPASAKAYLALRDVFISSVCRMNVPPVNDSQIDQLRGVMEKADCFSQQLLQSV